MGEAQVPCPVLLDVCGRGAWVAESLLVSLAFVLPSSFLQNPNFILVSTHSSHSPVCPGKTIPGLTGNG